MRRNPTAVRADSQRRIPEKGCDVERTDAAEGIRCLLHRARARSRLAEEQALSIAQAQVEAARRRL